MSSIDELRLRLEDAEQKFGLQTAETSQYSVRLVKVVDAIVDDLWAQRRDNERLSFENEEFRSMLMTLLTTMEGGDKKQLRDLMSNMVERITTLMAAGAGAPASAPVLEKYPEPEQESNPEPAPEIVAQAPEDVPPAPIVEEPAPVQAPDVDPSDVDTITAAVAELANNTDSIKPVLDIGLAPSPEIAPEPEPVSAPEPESNPVPAEISAVEKKPNSGEFADLYDVLDDIRELIGEWTAVDHSLPDSSEQV